MATTTSNNRHQEPSCSEEKHTQEQEVVDKDALVPQFVSHNITEGELATCCRVLAAVGSLNGLRKRPHGGMVDDANKTTTNGKEKEDGSMDDGLELYKAKNLRPLRKALASCLDLHKRTMFHGKAEEVHYEERQNMRSLKRQKVAESAMHQKYLESTQLRRGRVDRLNQLQLDAKEEELRKMKTMIPDGPVNAPPATVLLLSSSSKNNNNQLEEQGNDNQCQQKTRLPKLRSCYVCKVRYRELHHFYDQLCPQCAALNWEKRHQDANLIGRIAIVTGSRVKIGFQVCLKLLRAGAHVVATTRFPNSAVAAYRQEADFNTFASRLELYGLDLRDITGLEAFTRHLKQKYPQGIDILINNACQTVRRPVGYYIPLVEREKMLWENADDVHRSVLGGCQEFERVRRRVLLAEKRRPPGASAAPQLHAHDEHATKRPVLPLSVPQRDIVVADATSSRIPIHSTAAMVVGPAAADAASTDNKDGNFGVDTNNPPTPFQSTGLTHAAAMSQLVLLPEDAGVSEDVLPPGVTDIHGQQLDLRMTNSWMLKMEQVSTPEVVECMFINAIAPFVLNSRLKALMTQPQDDSRPNRFIINVSAMEGKEG